MNIVKHDRVSGVRALIKAGDIKTFQDIFSPGVGFPRTVLAIYLHMNNGKLHRLTADPSGLTIGQIKQIADYFEVPYETMLTLVHRQVFPFANVAISKTKEPKMKRPVE